MIRFTLRYRKLDGLKNAQRILTRNLKGGLEGLGRLLTIAAQKRMRRATGQGQRSLQVVIKRGSGLGMRMDVVSNELQAIVDAMGMPAGKFPPFGPGSKMFRWAANHKRASGVKIQRPQKTISHLSRQPNQKPKNLGRRGARYVKNEKGPGFIKMTKVQMTSDQRKAARNQNVKRRAFLVARSIYERGIAPSHWNKKALDTNRGRIIREISNALIRGVNEINRT